MENKDIDSIKFGEEYKDIVSGFVGYVTSKHLYATGCHQVGLSSTVTEKDPEGKVLYFDITRVERIGEGIIEDLAPPAPERGGPQAHPQRRS